MNPAWIWFENFSYWNISWASQYCKIIDQRWRKTAMLCRRPTRLNTKANWGFQKVAAGNQLFLEPTLCYFWRQLYAQVLNQFGFQKRTKFFKDYMVANSRTIRNINIFSSETHDSIRYLFPNSCLCTMHAILSRVI